MTTPPLPESPCLRVKLDYLSTNDTELGSRFYLSYAGSAPTGGNCATIAADIAAAWASHIAGLVTNVYSLVEVDVLDIATNSGASGQWTGSNSGGLGGGSVTENTAVNVEFQIARRYRGGKPRMFLPPSETSNLADGSHWTSSFLTSVNTAMTAFMAEIEALSVGAVGALGHVNLSYYQGFKNITNSSGRERAVPTYRNTALLDVVQGYAAKSVVGSQRRRRTSTTY